MDESPRRTRSGSQKRQRTLRPSMACTPGEFAQLEVAAERAGMSVSMFMRHQCLGTAGPRATRRPPVELRALGQVIGQLGKIGSNVNQIARVLNSGGTIPEGDLKAAIAEVRAASMAVQDMVLGKRRV
jgi:hypothetical protein